MEKQPSATRLYLSFLGWKGAVAMISSILSGPFAWFVDAVWNTKPQNLPLIAWLCLVITIVVVANYSAFQRLHDEQEQKRKDYETRLAAYDDPDLVLSDPIVELAGGGLWIARIALRHTGSRSVQNTKVRVIGISPIKSTPSLIAECREIVPAMLAPKNEAPGPFELHSQSSATCVEVAFYRQNDVRIFFAVSPIHSHLPLQMLPVGDYLVVLQATGHNAHEALCACVLGDLTKDSEVDGEQDHELVFRPLTKQIGDVLGKDHPLAKEFDHRINPPMVVVRLND
jgi:hypothetical protein